MRLAIATFGFGALVHACGGKGTFVDLHILPGSATPAGIKRLVVALDLNGAVAQTPLSEKDGSDIQFPTSASFEIRSGGGALGVAVSALDADGNELDYGTGSGNVASGDVARVDVHMQGIGRTVALSVRRLGAGTGRIVSTPAGIDCGIVCSARFPTGSTVTLTASTDFTSSVSGWTQASCSTSTTCPVLASSTQEVVATFNCNFDWVVDAANGADANSGGCNTPFKTIGKALAVVAAPGSVAVRPGLYDAANGESFPLAVPAGIALVGDEPNKGGGAIPTVISGGALLPSPSVATAVHPDANATIAGFSIRCVGFPSCAGILPKGNGVTIRNDTIADNAAYGIEVNGTSNHSIVGNVIARNNTAGIGYLQSSAGGKAENNVITGNKSGVEYQSAGGDLGGGGQSAGGNVLSCNTQNDVWTNQTSMTIRAANNFWDHVPPGQSCAAGGDVCSSATLFGATFDTTGAALAPSPCP